MENGNIPHELWLLFLLDILLLIIMCLFCVRCVSLSLLIYSEATCDYITCISLGR